MLFSDLVTTADSVAAVRGRLAKTERLADLLARLAPETIATAIGMLTGAPRQGKMGVGRSIILQARDVPPAVDATLTIEEVDDTLTALAALSGAGSTRDKTARLQALLGRATATEQSFLVRLLFGELRQGALEGVLLEGVARAAGIPAVRVRRAAMMAGDLGAIAHVALTEGDAALDRYSVQVMRPVQPMLADAANDVGAALEALGEAALEWKLDGARVQVHKLDDEVRVFSRNLLEVTTAVPEVVELARALPARSVVLDGEVIALRADGSPEPFQVTMRRFGRRLDVDRLRTELPLTPYLFDLLLVDDAVLVDEPQSRRFAALSELVGLGRVVPHAIRPTPEEALAFYDAAIRRGHEGVMAKAPASPYTAGHRGSAWLKVKASHTLDLVVLAAEWGSGRRQGWLSNLHLGARDTERGGFVMLGKTFKGLTDQMLERQTAEFLAREIGRDGHVVHVRPEIVVEIAFNDVQQSSRYPGGVALRLARVKRYRSDKQATDADTFHTVQQIFQRATSQLPPPRRN